MKAKVRLTDAFSGRSINVITKLENTEYEKYEFSFANISYGQRRKIEDFFGVLQAYHTKSDILRVW